MATNILEMCIYLKDWLNTDDRNKNRAPDAGIEFSRNNE